MLFQCCLAASMFKRWGSLKSGNATKAKDRLPGLAMFFNSLSTGGRELMIGRSSKPLSIKINNFNM